MVSSVDSGILKKTWTFLMGEWGKPLGEAYRAAKKATPDSVSIFKFDWKSAYGTEIAKLEAAKTAGTTKGFWGKLMGKLGPIVTAIAFGPRIFSAFKNDGIMEGLKETAKAAVSLAAFALGSVIVGMMGLTGILGIAAMFLIPMVVSMGADKVANSVLGESASEQRAQLAQQQEQLQKTQNNFDIYKNDPMFASLKKRFDERNNFNSNPFSGTSATGSARSVYTA